MFVTNADRIFHQRRTQRAEMTASASHESAATPLIIASSGTFFIPAELPVASGPPAASSRATTDRQASADRYAGLIAVRVMNSRHPGKRCALRSERATSLRRPAV